MTDDIQRRDDAAGAGAGGGSPGAPATPPREADTPFEDSIRTFAAAHPGAAGLLGALAHELRNPLAPLGTSLELLRRPDLPAPMKERALDVMGRQISHLRHLIDELIRLSHAGSPAAPAASRAGPQASAAAGKAAAVDAATGQPAGADPVDDPGRPATPCRVLIADDNELVQQSMVQLLTSEGYEACTASDGIEAIDLAAQWAPRFVILDAYMPRLSGIEAARRLRALHPPQRMTLLLMSGVALTEAWMKLALEAGFDDCLDKGAPPAQWLATLQRHRSRAA